MEITRVVLAGVAKDLRSIKRYPLGMLSMVLLAPLYGMILPSILLGSAFLVDGRSVGLASSAGTTDLVGFVFTGAMINSIAVGTYWGIAMSVEGERQMGTLEQCWVAPIWRAGLVLEYAITTLLVSLGGGLVLLVAGAVLFDAKYLAAIVTAWPAMAILIVAMVGGAYLVATAVLLLKRARLLLDGLSMLVGMLSGVMFPIGVMPIWLQAVSYALPTTYALDIVRHHGLGTPLLLGIPGDYAALFGIAALWLVLGRWAFTAAQRRIAGTGELAQH